MFYCYAPQLVSSSNGIKVLYLLAKHLNKTGIDTRVLCFQKELIREMSKAVKNGTIFLDGRRPKIRKNDIVLYSETESGNPMGATQIVRFFGNRPYHLTGKGIEYTKSDYLTAHSRAIDPHLPQLLIMDDETDLIHRLRRIKKGNEVSIYYGKVDMRTIIQKTKTISRLLPKFERVNVLTRNSPERRTDLLAVIARSKLLISFDPLSNTYYEATLLNTPVLLMDNSFEISSEEFNIPLWGISDSIHALERIEREVKHAFAAYKEHLESQQEMVAHWMEGVETHFDRIYSKNDAAYLEKNARLLERQKRIDLLRFSRFHHGRPLLNIAHPMNLPMRVLRALGQEDYILVKKAISFRSRTKTLFKKLGIFTIAYSIWKSLGLKNTLQFLRR
jgi:hypothetical protein